LDSSTSVLQTEVVVTESLSTTSLSSNMLDRKRLFVDVNYRGSRDRGFQETELNSSPLVLKQEIQNESLETPSLDQFEDQVSNAAKFFDLSTPDVMKVLTNPFTPISTSTSTSTGINVNPLKHFIKQEPVDDTQVAPVTSSSNSSLQVNPNPSQPMEPYTDYDLEFLNEPTPQIQQNLLGSLTTPVINPFASGNPFDFRQQVQQPTTFIEDPHCQTSFTDESATYNTSSQIEYAPPPQAPFNNLPVLSHETIHSSQLPESVIEYHGSHRQTGSPTMAATTSQYLMGPESPSGESSISSQTLSPGFLGSISHESSKRKRSMSDEGKGKRPTKKQQLDTLCHRKKSLENENHRLREDVAGYERACKRLKDMLYQRIREQRA